MGKRLVASLEEAKIIGHHVPGVSLRKRDDGALELFYPDAMDAAVAAVDGTDNKPGLYAYAALRRWRAETGGVTVNGMTVPTDQRTRGVLTGARVKADADPNYQIARWKAGAGQYLTLDAATIIAISDAVEAHIQECFAINATVDAAIADGSVTSESEIDAAFES